MAKLNEVVTGDKLLYHDKEFRKKIKDEMPSKTSDLTNDDNTVKDASYVHTDNNYTIEDANKLKGVESGADVNKIESISVNGAIQTISDTKSVDINVPTGTLADKDSISETELDTTLKEKIDGKADSSSVPKKISDLTNDSGFQTEAQVTAAVNKAVANAGHLKRKNVAALPTTDIDENIIYCVPDPSGKTGNEKIEYMYQTDDSGNKYWEEVGRNVTDLDGYVKNDDITEITNTQVDSIIAEVFEDTTTA